MRKLTFEGFLKQYVAELSGMQTASIHKLADCLSKNTLKKVWRTIQRNALSKSGIRLF